MDMYTSYIGHHNSYPIYSHILQYPPYFRLISPLISPYFPVRLSWLQQP